MPEALLDLDPNDLRDILQAGASNGPWLSEVLEKDVWVVWCLDALFRQPDAPDYAFKGGTSLSKVYGVIDRFSEDVDVTVSTGDPRILGEDDPLDDTISNTRRRALNDKATDKLQRYLAADLVPYLSDRASATLPKSNRPEFVAGADSVSVRYPSVSPQSNEPPYLERRVLLEFGTRGGTEPRTAYDLTTYLEDVIEPTDQLLLPRARGVMTLGVERTFWEKATLIHAELARPDRDLKARYARHWYDLHRLSTDTDIGPRALSATRALAHVIDIKKKQFRTGGVRYEDCGRGALGLVPDGEFLTRLRNDYRQMRAAGMFLAEPPDFAMIVDQLTELETTINATYAATPAI